MSNDNELLHELRDRVIRTESRIVQLGDHVGANLRTKQKIYVKQKPNGWYVEIDSLDVSVSRILAVLKERGISQPEINVWIEDRVMFTLYLQHI